MISGNKKTGQHGEDLAVDFLTKNGYHILEKNFRTKLGEIDIIAQDQDTISFVEVKSRTDALFGSPLEAITPFKRKKLSRAALVFLKQHRLFEAKARFDIVTIEADESGSHNVHLLKNAFELARPYGY